jgi:hypothetical protein
MKKFDHFLVLLSQLSFYLFCIFFIVTIFFKLNFFNHEWLIPSSPSNYATQVKEEQYNPDLLFINSLPKLEKYFLHEIEKQGLTQIEAIYFADQLLRDRFYHKDRVISIADNWSLYLFNFISKNRNNTLYISSLDPSDILKSEYALCNQQALIFQQLMRIIGTEYQSVLFTIPRNPNVFGHFASAARVGESWFFVDTNLEPSYQQKDASILPRLLDGDEKLFNTLYSEYAVTKIPAGAISVSSLNQNPAFYGALLQKTTYIVSNYFWLMALFFYIACRLFTKKVNV